LDFDVKQASMSKIRTFDLGGMVAENGQGSSLRLHKCSFTEIL